MASVGNAFDLLRSGEQPPSSKNKKKKSKSKQKTTADEGAPAVTTETVAETTRSSEVVELADAVPILEKSARTQGPNRNKLWKDWQRQVRPRSSPGCLVLVGC
jgi:hypothetical protein